ncbi:MAG TPA: PVC-type heme-binding CxxCH protein [Planctomycetota bacterium]|nr:PVC-type heme-binding CxxCH protein [Planctomycetota bacterium]
MKYSHHLAVSWVLLAGTAFHAPRTLLAGGAEKGSVPGPRVLREDLELSLFASEPDIVTPVAISVDGKGRVWAIESNTHFPPPGYRRHPSDRILVIADEDGDGKADRFTPFADGLKHTMGLALRPEGLYVATRREVSLLEDTNGDERADRTTNLARLETREEYPHNGLSGFAFDSRGWLYFAIGENMAVPYRLAGSDGSEVSGGPDGGSIFRMRPDGSRLERWARGFWNTFHLAFDASGRLFAVDNDPDSRPPCRLLHIVRGGDYGYRRWLGRKGLHPFTSWSGELPGTLGMVSGTGEAPSGIVAYRGAALGADLDGKLIVTSWGDHRLEVHTLKARGATFRSHPEPIVEGGEMFRPVGLAVAPDGSLFFSDWVDQDYNVHGKGRVWKLSARNRQTPGEGSTRRSAGGSAGTPGATLALEPRLDDADPARRATAVRHLSEGTKPAAGTIAALLRDPAPEVRLEALLAAQGVEGPGAHGLARDILETLDTERDPFLLGAAVGALSRLLDSRALLLESTAGAGRKLGILLALRRRNDPEARAAVPAFLKDGDLEVRRAAIQWVGEERLVEHAASLEEAMVTGPLSRPIFEAYLASRSLVAGETPEGRDTVPGDDFLLALARDRSRPPLLRALALRSVPPGHPGLDVLEGFLAERDPALRLEAVRTLRESPHPRALEALTALGREAKETPSLRAEAIVGLARWMPEAGIVLGELCSANEGEVRREAERALRLGAERPARSLPIAPEEKASLLEGGDPAEGERLFYYARGTRCSSCHAARGRGGVVGPDLSGAGHMPRARALESILEPGREVAPQYATWIITTPEGPRSGTLLLEGSDGSIHLGNVSGALERIPREAILTREMVETSLMPDGLAAQWTLDELRSLLAFLESLR